ncbi:somatostatin-like [Leucoraja erinacea]|uniref:somatostatin-like n=1 Tax=Leucoraja erinaceus TaxID=7782 RepID=UPI0024561D79|nr:somatostatin-like [Leucoraja erinacea]
MMWCRRVVAIAALLIALSVNRTASAPAGGRYDMALQSSIAQEDALLRLLRVVAEAGGETGQVAVADTVIPAEHDTPPELQSRPPGARMRKDCIHFFWKTYTLC